MKNITRGILLLLVAFATSAIYGAPSAPSAPGVAGVEVFVKQTPSKRTVTDARGNFVLDAPPGPCTLTFRAQKAKDTKTASTEKLRVAASYTIKVEGKRPVSQSRLANAQLSAGVDISVDVGGAKVRGQVLASGTKKMVWVHKVGSQMAGRWVEEDSAEAAGRNINTHSAQDFRDSMNRNANMWDPVEGVNLKPATR